MNAAVITKIEYQLPGEYQFTLLDVVPESGKLKEGLKQTPAGTVYTTVADFLIVGMGSQLDQLIKKLNNRKAYFMITDADNVIYLVGSVDYPARLVSQMELGGTPGSFKGYRCTLTQNSPNGCVVQ